MGTSGPGHDGTLQDAKAVFDGLESPQTPLSTGEVAAELDCDEETTVQRLETLAARGTVRNRRPDDEIRIWWRPDDGSAESADAESESVDEPADEMDEPADEVEFRTFVEAVSDYAIFTLDPDGTVASWNAGAERIKGYTADEIVGQHFSAFYTDADVAAGVPGTNLEVAVAEGRVEDEGWRVRADGTEFWANVTITAIRDDDGELRGFTKVTRDMTERREFEQRLQAERDLTEQIFETMPVGVALIDEDGTFVRANSHMLERHGIDESDLGEYGLDSVTMYDDEGTPLPDEDRPFNRTLDTGEPVYDFRSQVENPAGRRWLSVNTSLLETAQDEDERVIAAVTDVTQQKEREEQLRREREQTEQLLRTVPVAIAVHNADGEIMLANPRAQEALDLSEEELVGEPENADQYTMYDEDGNEVSTEETPSARVLATGEPVSGEEITIELPGGERRQFRINTAPVFDDDGQIHRVITAGEDVTALRDHQRELQRRKSELETELSEILGRISEAFYALDDEWRFTHLNDHAAEIMGVNRDEMLGREVWEVFPEVAEGVFWERFHEAMETQEFVSFELYVGEIDSWLEFSVHPSETGLSIYFQDVTERKRREQELARFETLFVESTDVNAVLNPDGTFEYLPPSVEKVLGYTPDELHGEIAFEYVHPEDQERIVAEFQELVENPDYEATNEFRFKHADGNWVWLESVGRNLLSDPHIEGIVAYTRDVTERRERERALQEREQRLERYETIVETVSDGVYVVDESGYFTMVNEAYADMLGYTPDELLGHHVTNVVDETTSDRAREIEAEMEQATAGQPTLEAELHTADGGTFPAEASFAMLPGEDPEWHRVGVARDVSERKERERKIEESERRYRTLVEHFPNGAVALFDDDLRFTAVGGQLLDEIGVRPEDRLGDSVYDLYPDELLGEIEPHFEAALAGDANTFEVEFHDRHLHANTLPIGDDPAEIYGGMLVVQDVTERVERERELERRTRQQQVIADLGQTALEADDLDDLMAEASRQVAAVLDNDYCKVLDLDAERRELLLRQGVGWREGFVGEGTVDADENSQAGYTLHSEQPVVVDDLAEETRFEDPDLFTSHDVTSGISTIIGAADDPWGILGTHDTDERDYTEEDVNFVKSVANVLAEAIERHQYETELEELVTDLEESNERLEQFAYAASHDLQEPLRMVSSYLQLIDRRYGDQFDEDGREFLDFAVDGANRMRDMIDGLLEYSRVDTRGAPFEPVDVEAVLADVRDDLRVKIEEHDATITAESLPEVRGDGGQLRQLFQNLLDNAIEYSGEEPPRIHVAADRVDDRWEISISDEGIGMDPEDEERIFDVFQTLHTRTEQGGTGLGLALCERIVERHGGDIWVESSPGEGSTFTFTLPVAGEQDE